LAVSHLCLARKLRRRAGLLRLMVMLRSPKRIVLLCPPEQARTTNFLGPELVRRGLLQGSCFTAFGRPRLLSWARGQ
jgi:hypothetical protein